MGLGLYMGELGFKCQDNFIIGPGISLSGSAACPISVRTRVRSPVPKQKTQKKNFIIILEGKTLA